VAEFAALGTPGGERTTAQQAKQSDRDQEIPHDIDFPPVRV
jgi:hypothetical protein